MTVHRAKPQNDLQSVGELEKIGGVEQTAGEQSGFCDDGRGEVLPDNCRKLLFRKLQI